MPTMRVLSIAYDDCLARKQTTDEQQQIPQLIKANQDFIQTLANEISQGDYEKTYLMIGSARQSYGRDQQLKKIRNNPSCFPVYQTLAQAIKDQVGKKDVSLDPYLLADSFAGLLPGTSFNFTVSPPQQTLGFTHPTCINDHSKVLLLYAQMHKMAVEHPDMSIEFNFYDDNDDEVLGEAYHTFDSYRNLIPHTASLTLHEYKGEQVTSFESIQGQGIINSSYAQTVKNIEEILQCNNIYRQSNWSSNAEKTNLDEKEFNTHHYKTILVDFEREAYLNMLEAAIAGPRLSKQALQKEILTLFTKLTRIEDINALFKGLTERRIQDKLNEHKRLVLDTALFKQKTNTYIKLEQEIKKHALKIIVATAHEKPLEEELKYLEKVRSMEVITRHRHNYWLSGAFGRTTSAQIIDTLIKNCRLQLSLVNADYNIEHVPQVDASEQAVVENEDNAQQAEAAAANVLAPQ